MKFILKVIYKNIFFKKYIFILIRKFYKPTDKIYQHLWFTGFFETKFLNKKFYIYSLPTVIENEIFWNGFAKSWEPLSLRVWSSIVNKKKVIFDIGANTGIYSILSKVFNPRSKVYSFEPNIEFLKAIKKSNHKNLFDINIVNQAVSDKNTTLNFDGYQITKRKSNEKVRSTRLDTFILNQKIKKVDLIKLDVELHEDKVILGMGKYLKKHKPDFLVEVLNDKIAKKLNKLFKGLNYKFLSIDDKYLRLKVIKKIKKSEYYNVFVCTNASYSLIRRKFKKYFNEI
tara:strand:- start:1090 stop:1944 length:855 start_codon:yes stop_codon:yes gene_type:complete